jgi:hypothetical protein
MIHASPTLTGLGPLEHEGAAYQPVAIRMTGMRWLVEYRSANGSVMWGDFPHAHGLYTPLTFDPGTGKTGGDASLEWWSAPLRELFSQPKVENSVVTVEQRRKADRYVVLNTLDFVFGHSLLLLLNAQHYLDHHPDVGLIIACTKEMKPYLPEDTAEVWELQCRLTDTQKWHQPLDDLFARRCREVSCAVATGVSHPAPERYQPERFNLGPSNGQPNREAPRILFIYRGSRLWGSSDESERNRLQRLGRVLAKIWPKSRLEIHGHVPLPKPVAGWQDCTRRSGGDYDTGLVAALRDADLVFGAHGSSMLMPTAISRLVIELVPMDKQTSLLQDTLFNVNRWSLREHFWRLRFLYGNGTMTDISPHMVAQVMNSMISMEPHFSLYQGRSWDDLEMPPNARANRYADTVAPAVEQWLLRRSESLRLAPDARFWQWVRRQAGERD